MLKNYIITAWRNITKNKSFSAINILGLALGMACSLLIWLWVSDERNVDGFHANADRLYAVYERQTFDGKTQGVYYTPGVLPDEMKRTLPEVQYASGMGWNGFGSFRTGDKMIKIQGNAAGADFFSMFSYPLLEGDAKTALSSPESIAISRSMATRLFGSVEKAFQQTLRYDNAHDLKITAVFEDLPKNASERFEYLINWKLFSERNEWVKEWGNNGPLTYLVLNPGTNAPAFESKIKDFIKKYNDDPGFKIQLGIQRYDEKYLHSNFKEGYISGGRIEYVRLFSIVALFIIVIACINFMNLTTARSVKRAKEIGVRKVVGGTRPILIRQFMSEAMMLSLLAVVIALVMAVLLLPVFNTLTGKSIELPYQSVTFWLMVVGLTAVTGILSGSYPALLLSSFKPVTVLKGKGITGTGAVWFRKGLVVFQFVLSILLIVGMLVISQQVNYIQTTNIGYQKSNLLYMPLNGELVEKYPVFKQQVVKLPGIAGITRMSQRPVEMDNSTGGIDWQGKDPNLRAQFTQAAVGYDFIKTIHAQLLQGRDFSIDHATDTNNYILNEAALAKTGYKDPIGKPFTQWGRKGQIIGIVKDFHYNSLYVPIEPLVLRLSINERGNGFALIRTEPGKTKEAIASLESVWKQINPQFPFSHQFADEEYVFVYKSEQVIQQLSNYFAFLAIFISCLGLLGLVMFTAEQRTREIGIRKVLGAGAGSLFALLSKDFLVLVAIAFIIASPIAWWAMNSWLQNFAYRIPVHWWIFGVAGASTAIIALLTISGQAIKTILMNPVKSLRSE